MSKAYTRRRLAGGELPLSCCAMTSDGKHVVAGGLGTPVTEEAYISSGGCCAVLFLKLG